MDRAIVWEDTWPAVETKSLRVQTEGIRCKAGNSCRSKRALLPLSRAINGFSAHCGVADRTMEA